MRRRNSIPQVSRTSEKQRLVELASWLFRESQALAFDEEILDFLEQSQTLNVTAGIDFYAEVRRFEIRLIRLALGRTGGNQRQAAQLLGLKPTTLHYKLKLFNIQNQIFSHL